MDISKLSKILPQDTLLLIFEDLDIISLLACIKVCSQWRNVIETHPKLFWWKHDLIKPKYDVFPNRSMYYELTHIVRDL